MFIAKVLGNVGVRNFVSNLSVKKLFIWKKSDITIKIKDA